jgi:Na+-translocating ferredoxin:NAD+ oxidoreductase RnfG subunit
MTTHWLKLAIVPAALVGPAVAGYSAVYLTVEQAQRAIFPSGSFSEANVKLTSEQRKAIETASGVRQRGGEVRAWRVSSGGWLIVDEVIGKHEFITFAVGIGADGGVRGVEILEYRESYGGEVRNPKWRAQFVGKTKAAPLKLDADIKNISGATLSSRHIAEGVKRLLAVHAIALAK